MRIDWVYIAMFEAVEELYDERLPGDFEIGLYVNSGASDPYMTLSHKPFGEKYSVDFEEYAKRNNCEDPLPGESYELVAAYLEDRYGWGKRFREITKDEWACLCGLIEDQESNRTVSYVGWSGFTTVDGDIIASLVGKTVKWIEREPSKDDDDKVLFHTGSSEVLLRVRPQSFFGREVVDFYSYLSTDSFSFASICEGEPRRYLIGERVTGVEIIRYAASIDGAPLEGRPEDGYDFERMPGQHMAVVVRTKEGVYSFYRHGCDDRTIHLGRSVPTDEELGLEEFRAFWAEGGHEVEVRRDVFEVE